MAHEKIKITPLLTDVGFNDASGMIEVSSREGVLASIDASSLSIENKLPSAREINIEHEELSPDESVLLEVMRSGDIQLALDAGYQLLAAIDKPMSRKLDFYRNGQTYSLSGIGVVETDRNNSTVLRDHDGSQTVSEYMMARGMEPLGTTYVDMRGNEVQVINDKPLGVLTVDGFKEKLRLNTLAAEAVGQSVVVPEFIAWGAFPGKVLRNYQAGWAIQRTPFYLHPEQIPSVKEGRLTQAALNYLNSSYTGIRALHPQLPHAQLHQGNRGLVVGGTGKARAIITDFETTHVFPQATEKMLLSKDPVTYQGKSMYVSPRQLACVRDLTDALSTDMRALLTNTREKADSAKLGANILNTAIQAYTENKRAAQYTAAVEKILREANKKGYTSLDDFLHFVSFDIAMELVLNTFPDHR